MAIIKAKANIVLWHLVGDTDKNFPAPIPMGGVRTHVKVGDLIGYADNTGAPYESSGDHLHLGLIPVNDNQFALQPGNGFNGCIDPLQYLNPWFAKDADKVVPNLTEQVSLLQKVVSLLTSWLSTHPPKSQ